MEIFKNLILIGTSHIAKQSIKEVKETINTHLPVVVAVELDQRRLAAVMNPTNKTDYWSLIKHVGLTGFLFTLLGSYVQKKLGKYVNTMPGSEMKTAIKEAKKNKLKVALIDQDIAITMRNFSDTITWKERWQFVKDMFWGIFYQKKMLRDYGLENFDLRTVPGTEMIAKMMKVMKKSYPNVYKSLLADRNKVMARRLWVIMNKYPEDKIVAVVGAGHEEGILKILKRYVKNNVEVSLSFGEPF
ncbi:TraB/GumN family protein [Nanoarchaeota archaeon]